MKRAFLRLFFSIVSITMLIILIQAVLVFYTNNRLREEWSQDVYKSYLDRVKELVEANAPPEGWTIETVGPALVHAADDRISGLLVRDTAGNLVSSFGKTPRGILLPLALNEVSTDETWNHDFQPNDEVEEDVVVEPVVHVPQDATQTFGTGMTIVDKGKKDLKPLPIDVSVQDVAGTVDLFYNHKKLGTVDVLTFTPMTYKFTADLLRSYLATFILSLPIALVISLILGFFVTRHNVKFSEAISRSLLQLSEGEHNVPLPQSKVSDYQRIAAAISHLDQRLQDHERARQAWLCSISHDLNTPVTSMKLLLDGMSDGVFPLDTAYVEKIRQENDLLQGRIQSVVTYSTLQSPDTVADINTIEVLELVDAVIRQFPQEDEMRVDVQVDTPTISCDFSLMQIACQELLRNALEASSGRVQWKIRKVNPPNNLTSIAIEMDFINDGHLAATMTMADFFEPWSRGDQSRTASGGSGLGLPIVGQVMRLHNGSATIRSLSSNESTQEKVVAHLLWPAKE